MSKIAVDVRYLSELLFVEDDVEVLDIKLVTDAGFKLVILDITGPRVPSLAEWVTDRPSTTDGQRNPVEFVQCEVPAHAFVSCQIRGCKSGNHASVGVKELIEGKLCAATICLNCHAYMHQYYPETMTLPDYETVRELVQAFYREK